jgi:hypothetical protein
LPCVFSAGIQATGPCNGLGTNQNINQSVLGAKNRWLSVEIFPEGGGKITSIYNKLLEYKFLWKNEQLNLQAYPAGISINEIRRKGNLLMKL